MNGAMKAGLALVLVGLIVLWPLSVIGAALFLGGWGRKRWSQP